MLRIWRNLQIYHNGRFTIKATTSKDIVPKHCMPCCTIRKQIESTIMVGFQQKTPLAYKSWSTCHTHAPNYKSIVMVDLQIFQLRRREHMCFWDSYASTSELITGVIY